MAEPTDSHEAEVVVQLTPWGDFFVWTTDHIELLRRRYRVIGHLSTGPSTNTTHSICLPLILSIEESAFLLYREIAILQSTQPVRNLNPASPRSLARYDEMLDQHYQESVEIFKRRKRQKTLSYYGDILKGQKKRKERQAAKSNGDVDNKQSFITNESANPKLSKRQQRKLNRRERQKITSAVEAASNYVGDGNSLDELVAEGKLKNDESTSRGCLPTLEDLTSTTAVEDNASLLKYIPLHRPRPTPKEWIREGEHSPLPVPLTVRGNIEKVARWLLEVSSKSRPESDETTVIRCRVFDDLWSRGFYVTCSAAKMGGDFLVYQGDPLLYHASHVVIVNSPQAPIYLSHLAASLRIANSVRKALVIATVVESNGAEGSQNETNKDIAVAYTSLYWMGSRIPPKNV
ncbi:hypothetical protein Aperf_G00000127231 [Anoplocephala perfoliata]